MWYYQLDNHQNGPGETDTIKNLIAERRINGDTLVWKEGMSGWRRLSETELASFILASPPPLAASAASPPPLPPPAKNPPLDASIASTSGASEPSGVITAAWVLILLTFIPRIGILASIGALICGILLFKSENQKGRSQGKLVLALWTVTFLISLLVGGATSASMSKDDWRSKAPNSQLIKTTSHIICSKSALIGAVGSPDKTQTVGDSVYLYWECSDGQIQVIAQAAVYNTAGQIIGTVNDY